MDFGFTCGDVTTGFFNKKGPHTLRAYRICTKDADTKMGEEKPEEELMGKRKSSPRFDSISRRRHFYDCLGLLKYT